MAVIIPGAIAEIGCTAAGGATAAHLMGTFSLATGSAFMAGYGAASLILIPSIYLVLTGFGYVENPILKGIAGVIAVVGAIFASIAICWAVVGGAAALSFNAVLPFAFASIGLGVVFLIALSISSKCLGCF